MRWNMLESHGRNGYSGGGSCSTAYQSQELVNNSNNEATPVSPVRPDEFQGRIYAFTNPTLKSTPASAKLRPGDEDLGNHPRRDTCPCTLPYILIYVVIGVPVGFLVLGVSLFAQPTKRGFFCDDETIRYPLQPSTVSTLVLTAFGFIIPVTIFFIVEGFRLFDASTPRDSWHSVSSSLLKNIYEIFGVFIFGAGLMQITVDIGKYSIGRLRPHFLAACNPYPQVCTGAVSEHTYITDYVCAGDSEIVEEARLSFPSGHAALSFYAAVYTTVFLQQRLYWRGARLPRHLLQFVLLMLAWFTALSRVMDNMHHPTDVLAGIVIGTVWALFMAFFLIDMGLVSNNATKEELRSLRATPLGTPGPNNV